MPSAIVKPPSEKSIVNVILKCASEWGAILFRNPRGVERIAQKDCKSCQRFGRVVSYGLDQRRILTALETAGAVQGVVRSAAELETVLAPWRGRQP
jgi:hypothetical protein